MPRALKIGLLLLLTVINACSSRQLGPPEPRELNLLPPADISSEVLLKQKVSFVARGQQQQFLVVARFLRQHLRLILLLPTGQTLLTLDYDGENLALENRSTVDLPGREILASMQFALWPEDSLRQHYPTEAGWQLNLEKRQRLLLAPSGAILKIAGDAKTTVVSNHLHDYRVIIETLEKDEL